METSESKPGEIISDEVVMHQIYLLRGEKVILDQDLAFLYQVETKQLKRQVRRNIERFPGDFMFELNAEEIENLRCQIGTSSWGGTRYAPMAFTEQGVAMLSSVLSSPVAIQVNIRIMRVFTRLRKMLGTQEEVKQKVKELEFRLNTHDEQIGSLIDFLKQYFQTENEREAIGFKLESKQAG
ncbi:MAG: ORF6N domain-containing protein [Bacteroidia bacterium]|nr:ORF6N domain-containing protein [Bacteroidia bacterium]